jgi:hypothetical protein
MEFQLLYDFLKSGKTQKAFTQEVGGSPDWVRVKILKQLRKLERTKLIDLNDYVKDKHSILAVEVRRKRDMWMKAIEAYNEAYMILEEQKPMSIDLTRVEIARLQHWYNTLQAQNSEAITEEDHNLHSKLEEKRT